MSNKNLAQLVYDRVRGKADRLLPRLNDPRPEVREAAAEALGRLGCLEAVPALIQLLNDSERAVRWAAAGALGDIGSTDALPELIKLGENRDPGSREAAAQALGAIGSDQAVQALLNKLKDPSAQVRLMAIEALGHIGSTEALVGLKECAEGDDELQRRCAATAIERIRSAGADLLEAGLDDAPEPVLADHPPMESFAEGVHGAWTGTQIEHVRRCDFCQRLVAVEWTIRHPEVKTLAAYSADPSQFPYVVAMQRHLGADGCRLCTLLLLSPLVAALAALTRLGKELELVALSLRVRLPLPQQMAPTQEQVYAYESAAGSSLTVHEGENGSLLVLADINPASAASGSVRLEIIGEHAQRAHDPKVGEDLQVGSVTQAAREFGEDVALVAASVNPESLKELANWLVDANTDLRLAAAEAVGTLGAVAARPEILGRLAELLQDQEERVRKAAEAALARYRGIS